MGNTTTQDRETIVELFADFGGEYEPVDIDWGEPAGEEIW